MDDYLLCWMIFIKNTWYTEKQNRLGQQNSQFLLQTIENDWLKRPKHLPLTFQSFVTNVFTFNGWNRLRQTFLSFGCTAVFNTCSKNLVCVCVKCSRWFWLSFLFFSVFKYRKWYSFDANNIHLQQLIFYRVRWYSSKREDDGCLHGMIINHCRWYSTTGDDNHPMRMITNHWGWWSVDIDDISSAADEYYLSRTISVIHNGW
jgi:hypothetical protein